MRFLISISPFTHFALQLLPKFLIKFSHLWHYVSHIESLSIGFWIINSILRCANMSLLIVATCTWVETFTQFIICSLLFVFRNQRVISPRITIGIECGTTIFLLSVSCIHSPTYPSGCSFLMIPLQSIRHTVLGGRVNDRLAISALQFGKLQTILSLCRTSGILVVVDSLRSGLRIRLGLVAATTVITTIALREDWQNTHWAYTGV